MKLLRLLPPSAAVAVGFVLLSPEESSGFSLLGSKLNLDNRHVRVVDNFSDASANDNVTPDPNFPGATGAALAIWKGCVEWGSIAHGDGGGDPTQSVGSGASNFDCSWQGIATSVLKNCHSELSGSDGGVLAFASGGGFGWNIYYYSGWKWADGPGNPNSGEIDLQGVATHEYGHALGLGHSEFSNATMRPSIISNGVPTRSIEADDIAGIQAIYGTMSVNKPLITSVVVAGDSITIEGTGFGDVDNEVWFTRREPVPTGEPLVAAGVDSTNGGTLIEMDVPDGVGPGDLLVVRDGQGLVRMSNPWPYDAEGDPLPPPGFEQPIITGVDPPIVPNVTLGDELSLTLTGVDLSGTDAITVGGVTLSDYLPQEFTVLSTDTVALKMPLVDELGPVEIRLEKNGLEAIAFVDVAAPSPPVLELGNGGDPEVLFSFFESSLTMGGNPGTFHFLWVSPDNVPSTVPELDLGIGNGFSSLLLLGSFELPPSGWVQLPLVFSGIQDVTLYFQTAEFDPLVGVSSIAESNVAEGYVAL